MQKLKSTILKIHFGILFLVLLNFIIRINTRISLNSNLIFYLKILLYVTALILFFVYIKPFKKLSIYFSLYIISPFLIFISWLIDGIFGALLSSFFIFFFAPNDIRFENNKIIVTKPYQGFLGRCCHYEIIEKRAFLFEKKIGDIDFDESLYFKEKDIQIKGSTIKIHLVLKNYNHENDDYMVKDTTLVLPLNKQ
ncbi:hypothetical protein GKZ90_0020250 [Flavobacterium sp. MC2016-06]|jgi:hypothetical protein|uniref:hypothetical protein n=1 Tax=Flavobacterium sp. MC2016-06 TaxID=2676308 RepID=UPI0012BAC8C4|nr:hypothetical protein [Flavobacterium sp. MC2016-06]MBU3860925.1 hypothetical protein [Flavobacterium sp. MC2016-06]